MCILIFSWWYVVQSVHLHFHSAIEALKLRTRCATLPVSRFSFGRVTVAIPHPNPNQNDYRFWEAWFLAISTLTPTNPSAQAILAKPFVLTGLRPPLVEGVGVGAVGKHMSKMVEKIWGKWFKRFEPSKKPVLWECSQFIQLYFRFSLSNQPQGNWFGLWNDPTMNLMTILHGNSTYFGPQDHYCNWIHVPKMTFGLSIKR